LATNLSPLKAKKKAVPRGTQGKQQKIGKNGLIKKGWASQTGKKWVRVTPTALENGNAKKKTVRKKRSRKIRYLGHHFCHAPKWGKKNRTPHQWGKHLIPVGGISGGGEGCRTPGENYLVTDEYLRKEKCNKWGEKNGWMISSGQWEPGKQQKNRTSNILGDRIPRSSEKKRAT